MQTVSCMQSTSTKVCKIQSSHTIFSARNARCRLRCVITNYEQAMLMTILQFVNYVGHLYGTMLMVVGHEHAVRVEPAVLCWSWERFKINKEGFSTISAFCGKMMVWLVVSHCTATSTVLYSQNIVTVSSFALKTPLKCLKMIEKYRL